MQSVLASRLMTKWKIVMSGVPQESESNCVLSCIKSRSREVILSLCSALVRLHIQLWCPQFKNNMELFEQVQRRP